MNSTINSTSTNFISIVRLVGIPYFTILILFGTIGNILSLLAILGFGRSHNRRRYQHKKLCKDEYFSIRSLKGNVNRCESGDSDTLRHVPSSFRYKRQTSWIIFSTLSIADTISLWINPVRYLILFIFNYDMRMNLGVRFCQMHILTTYASRDFATWVLCLLTLERYIQAGFPHKAQFIWSGWKKASVWIIVVIMIVVKNALPINSLKLIEKKKGFPICDTDESSPLRKSFFVLDIIVYSILPTILLLYLNIALLKVLRKAKLLRIYGWMNTHRINSSIKLKKSYDSTSQQATRLLIPVSIFHLITTTPLCIFSIIENEYMLKRNNELHDTIFGLGQLLVMLAYSNNGVNCLIYFLSSKSFRKRLIYLLSLDTLWIFKKTKSSSKKAKIIPFPSEYEM